MTNTNQNATTHNATTWKSLLAVMLVIGTLLGSAGPGATGADAAKNRTNRLKLQEFENTSPITISDNATSIASTIQVSGLAAPIAEIAVSLNSYNHPQPADVDVLLVGPGGQTAMIMSDAGAASGPATNANLLFRDTASRQLPLSDAITSGVYQPTNYEFTNNPDKFSPDPRIPSPLPSGSALAIFSGASANGAWTLFIDDGDNDTPDTNGSLAGWRLRITTANGVPVAGDDQFQAQAGQTLTVPAAGVLANDSDPDGDPLTAVQVGQPKKGEVLLEADGSFIYLARKKAKGLDSFTYLAQDEEGLNALATVDIQIKGKKHKKRKKR